MRKILIVAALLTILSAQVEAFAISDIDIYHAEETVRGKLRHWDCTEIRTWYGGDDLNNEENIAYMNDLALSHGFARKFIACMVIYSDFHSPSDDEEFSALNPDSDYKNWSWYFGFYESDGDWKLLTWGY